MELFVILLGILIEGLFFFHKNDARICQKDLTYMIKIIDLFAGAGGLTQGFMDCDSDLFAPVWANDFNKPAADTYNANFGEHCFYGDIKDFLSDKSFKVPKADLVIGGPPCQGFSLLNSKREGDERRSLWKEYFEFVKRSGSSMFVMENVPQLIDSDEYFEIVAYAQKLGFKVTSDILLAADYGVPQIRKRAFIIGSKKVDPAEFFPPKRTHYNCIKYKSFDEVPDKEKYVKNPKPWTTIRDVISDLPLKTIGVEINAELGSPLDLHFGRTPTSTSLLRYKAIPKEGMNRFDLHRNAPELTPKCWANKPTGSTDIMGRLWWDRPAYTIRTEFFKPEKGRYLHPQAHRPISHREAARFQSFPDNFKFCGTKIEIAKQIGNAVPPKLAIVIAKTIKAMHLESEKAEVFKVNSRRQEQVSAQL